MMSPRRLPALGACWASAYSREGLELELGAAPSVLKNPYNKTRTFKIHALRIALATSCTSSFAAAPFCLLALTSMLRLRPAVRRLATKRINLNADLAEGYGPWRLTDDAALMDIVTTANVACGGHAGDAAAMARACALAATKGVSVGAHPGYDDKPGFGRRAVPLSMEEVEELVAVQLGALRGISRLARARHGAGVEVTHVKPHGALNNVACVDSNVAAAICRAIRAVDASLIVLAPAGSELLRAAEDFALPRAAEVFADRGYLSDGTLAPRHLDGALIVDAAEAARNAVRLASCEPVRALDTGADVVLQADSVCVHGDKPSAVAQARAVRDALVDAGFELAPLPEIVCI